jgi:hypothetical protein
MPARPHTLATEGFIACHDLERQPTFQSPQNGGSARVMGPLGFVGSSGLGRGRA